MADESSGLQDDPQPDPQSYGFVIDPDRPRYGDWTFGWLSEGSIELAFQAWLVRGLP